MSDSIHSRAMLVSLSVSTWTARKFDRAVTEKVNRDHDATPDAGRYHKHLFGGECKTHSAALAAAGAARRTHYTHTLPWTDEGWRILPTANYFVYSEAMRKARAAFEVALADFLDEYPSLRWSARRLLNGMYREGDYPAVEDLKRRFRFVVDFTPLPAAGDFRVSLPADHLSQIEQSVTSRIERATAEATGELWRRLHDVVQQMHQRLSDPDKRFRGSLIENVRVMVDALRRMNIANDPELDAMRDRVERELTFADAQTLRENAGLRGATAGRAAAIIDAMSAFYKEA